MSLRRTLSRPFFLPVALAGVAVPALARAAADAGGGIDVLAILGELVIVLIGARLGGALFTRFGQSSVLGELLFGILAGNLALLGVPDNLTFHIAPGLPLLAEIGVLFLLFEVGLHSDIREMARVGLSALLVAVLGVVAPMVLGYFASAWFFPGHNPLTHWFVGATLCATSVGITARVLKDLGRTTSTEGRIILGAAVIDDVLGLIVLAVVSGIIQAADRGAEFNALSILWVVAKSVFFLVAAVLVGGWLSRHTFRLASALEAEGALLPIALVFCFGLAYLAGVAGLAPIVGAFAAGLILDEVHYRDLKERDRRKRDIPDLLEPLASFLVPVFFVLMGMRVDLRAFGMDGVLGFAAVLTLAAIVGKQACSLGVLEKGADRIAVGLGMIPRGEVGLIFASIGATLTIAGERVIDDAVFSAVVVMVAITTMMTPPLLTWRMKPGSAASA